MLTTALIAVAGFVAGVLNSIAGGGSFVSFPALLAIGRDAVIANATNTVAIWPASFAGMVGFRQELATARRWLILLVIPSFIGGILGAVLLLRTPTPVFEKIVPFLILGATVLLGMQELLTRKVRFFAELHANPTAGSIAFAFVFQFAVSVYGGYFGAGMGILMLAALGLIGLRDMHQMNGLKNLMAICINGIAAIWFIASGAVVWRDVAVMGVTAVLGGYVGARLARRLGRGFVRASVVVIGVVMSIALFVRL